MNTNSIDKDEQALQKINSENEKVVIGYMMNPDKVYYNEMDDEIIRNLESKGATVQRFFIEEIYQ